MDLRAPKHSCFPDATSPLPIRRGSSHAAGAASPTDSRRAACPECGATPEHRTTKIKQVDAQLTRFEELPPFGERLKVWGELERDPASACGRYRKRFSVEPLVVHSSALGPRFLIDADDKSQANKERVYAAFLAEAKRRGFAVGWASHRYRDVFAVWPAGFVPRVRGRVIGEELNQKLRECAA